MKEPLDKWDEKLVEHLLKHGDDLSFTKYFWKECEANEGEHKQYARFSRATYLSHGGLSHAKVARALDMSYSTVWTWSKLSQLPKLGHYLKVFLALGEPRDRRVWLSVNNSPGHAVPLGPLVEVPLEIRGWEDIEPLLAQLQPTAVIPDGLSRTFLFGFLLGMVIGDAAKPRQGEWHRHLNLTLSEKYSTNRYLGEFTCLCAASAGLRMERATDLPRSHNKPHGFYCWTSQTSALIDWIYNVCLGLTDEELTTYDAVRMNWALTGPDDFRRGLIQGLAESDGSVNIASQTVEFWIGPNWEFGAKLLGSFGLHSFRSREALCVSKAQVVKSLAVPLFSPLLKTVRYTRYQKLAGARRMAMGGSRLPDEVRGTITRLKAEGFTVSEVSEKIIDAYGISVSFEALKRWAGRHLGEGDRKTALDGGTQKVGQKAAEY